MYQLNCAQKHVALATGQVNSAQHLLDDKMSTLGRLSIAVKERVDVEYKRILKQAEAERNQAFAHIDQMIEQLKKPICDKSTRLKQLPLNEISAFAQGMASKMKYIHEDKSHLFGVSTTLYLKSRCNTNAKHPWRKHLIENNL
jgi:hypothetical protein